MSSLLLPAKKWRRKFASAKKAPNNRSLSKFAILLTFAIASITTASAAVPKLTVSGSQILVGGQAEGMAGNSFFWTNNYWGGEPFYNKPAVQWLKNDWKSRIVRVAMGVDENGAYLQDRARNKEKVTTLVNAAIDEDLYVIIDWHSHHAEDYRAEAIEFFREMAQTYGSYNNVIYEIYNEPLNNVSWSSTIKPYAEAVIAAIRAEDPDNLIVVGTPTWSQDVHDAAADPITSHSNIAYALHFYAGTHTQWLRDRADAAMASGIALMVTEWGTVNANGDGGVATAETNRWVDWMKDRNLIHLNWSVNDKAEGASIVKPGASPTGGWSDSDLTDSGRYVKAMMIDYNNGDSNNGGGGTGGNQAPTVNISNPSGNLTVNEGYDLYVLAEAFDSDGSVDNVRLYIDGDFIRQERYVPYEWGHAGSPNPNEVNGLPAGSYTILVEATDNEGRKGGDSFTLTVNANNGGGGDGDNNGGGDSCQNYTGGRMEADLANGTCIDFGRNLSGRTLQVWDSDTNSSCNFRGSVTSEDGNGSLNVNKNYVSARGAFTGTSLNFASNNNCRFVKVRVY